MLQLICEWGTLIHGICPKATHLVTGGLDVFFLQIKSVQAGKFIQICRAYLVSSSRVFDHSRMTGFGGEEFIESLRITKDVISLDIFLLSVPSRNRDVDINRT